jgi:hypothetical protein
MQQPVDGDAAQRQGQPAAAFADLVARRDATLGAIWSGVACLARAPTRGRLLNAPST